MGFVFFLIDMFIKKESLTHPRSGCGLSELRMPITEGGIEVAIEYPGSSLKEEGGPIRCPLHLLFFHEAFAGNLVAGNSTNISRSPCFQLR